MNSQEEKDMESAMSPSFLKCLPASFEVGNADNLYYALPGHLPIEEVTTADMLRASEVCAHAAKHPLNRGEIASILDAASRILANTSLRPALANDQAHP